jgi:hypothetical protein
MPARSLQKGFGLYNHSIRLSRAEGPARAELAYSYSLEGHYYSGYYQREFGSEEDAWDFVRDLRGRSAFVSYNAQQPQSHSSSKMQSQPCSTQGLPPL